jgi:hypothetical protein
MLRWRNGIEWAGLALGPAAWGLSTQANYSLARWSCTASLRPIPPSTFVLVLIALAGAAMSWRAWYVAGASRSILLQDDGRPASFLALLSMLVALLFAAVILMQGAAALILTGCER